MGIRRRYIIGGVVLALATGYLLYLSFSSSVSYYVTVSEFFDKGTELHNTSIRVAGKIADNPVDWNAEELELSFTITEGGDNMAVLYNGAEPSNFEAGANVLVEGRYDSDGIFRATQLIMRCPSKYEPEE